MRRPNHASRAAASTVVGSGSLTGKSGNKALGDTGLRSRDTGTEVHGPLEALEQEVKELRDAIESEQSEIAILQRNLTDIFAQNSCEEYLEKLEKRIGVFENKAVETVLWRIEHVEKVRSRHSRGEFITSPSFSAGGLDGFCFHFYPRGDNYCEEGYCSLYLEIPPETRVSWTLFLGRAKHGPDEAEGQNCGVSEMCVLSNEIDKQTGSIVIGVEGLQILRSPDVIEERTKLLLNMES